MKKLYWRPSKISKTALFLIAILAVSCLIAVEHFKSETKQKYYAEKIQASELALKAMETLKAEKIRRKIKIDPEVDPSQSGMVGELISIITSDSGSLEAKQTSTNPNFAAVVVDFLKTIKVKKGDTVYVGLSGSFPALNISVYAALKALDLNPVIISSASASQWGANIPGLSWLEMERILYDKNIFPYLSKAASLGGVEDRGFGMSQAGKKLLRSVIEKYGIEFIDAKSYSESLERRLEIYKNASGKNTPVAYINVGGGTVSVGTKEGKYLFKPGLNTKSPFNVRSIDSIMSRFIQNGIPVIHLIKAKELAETYKLPVAPQQTPKIGEGGIYVSQQYNLWLVGLSLLILIVILYVFIRSDLGFRLLQTITKSQNVKNRPKQMV